MSFTPRTRLFVSASRIPLVVLLACGGVSCGNENAVDQSQGELGDGYRGDPSREARAALEIPEGSPRVAFLGDSLTAGLHLAADEAWPAALQRSLFDAGHPFFLQNAGVSGDTTADGVRRLEWTLKSEPDIVVVGLGANNGLRGIDLESTENDLRAIVGGIREAGAVPLLLGMNVPTNLGAYAVEFSKMFPRIAEDLDVAFVPNFLDGVGGIPEMNLPDGIHPTAEGHERLAENVEPELRALLAR